MISNNLAVYSLKILGEIVRDILFFPFWWYSRGLLMAANKLIAFLCNRQKSLALLVWIKNIHRPMYGQQDWQGKLISFFMRLMQIIFRGIIMFFWLIAAAICFAFWLILPFLIIYEIIFQIM